MNTTICDATQPTPGKLQWFSDVGSLLVTLVMTLYTLVWSFMKRGKLARGGKTAYRFLRRIRDDDDAGEGGDINNKIQQIHHTTINIHTDLQRVQQELDTVRDQVSARHRRIVIHESEQSTDERF